MSDSAGAVTARYLARCASTDDGLRTVMEDLPLPPAMRVSSGHRLLPRPLFAGHEELASFARDAAALFEVLVSLPERLFDGNLDAYCAALGLDGRRAELNRSTGGVRPPLYGRADMYHDGTGFRLLEFNIASELGGVDRAGEIPRLLLGSAAFTAFAVEERLSYVHTGQEVVRTLREAGHAVTGGREPVVALLEGPGGMAAYGDDWRAFQEMMRGFALDLRLGEIGDLAVKGGGLVLDGARVDVVLRAFSVDELCAHRWGRELLEPVVRAHRGGQVVLWTPLESNLYGNKACLALLHEPRTRAVMSAEEVALVERLVPWTGRLGAADGPDLVKECLARRDELVLKPHAGYGGAGVVAGWECAPERWESAVRGAAADGAVVQRRVMPREEQVTDPASGEIRPWHAAWGTFLTPHGYAGTYARLVPAHERAVIGVEAGPNARVAGVFTTPD